MCAIGRISSIPHRIATSAARLFPDMTIKSDKTVKAFNWIGQNISSPQNRLILGVTALMSQPFIDLHNKKVDEDTRKYSAVRTVAKIIAGTTTGFLIRWGCIKVLDKFTLLPSEITPAMKHPKLRMLFTPDAAKNGVLKDLTHYKYTWGTYMALGVMLFTNFLIDAPLTKSLTNKFIDVFHLNKNDKKEVKNV